MLLRQIWTTSAAIQVLLRDLAALLFRLFQVTE